MHAPVVLEPAPLEAHAVVASGRPLCREMYAVTNAEVELAVLEVAAARTRAVHRVERDAPPAEREMLGLKVRAILQRQRGQHRHDGADGRAVAVEAHRHVVEHNGRHRRVLRARRQMQRLARRSRVVEGGLKRRVIFGVNVGHGAVAAVIRAMSAADRSL